MSRANHRYRDPEAPALDGGRWVRRGLVYVWQPGPSRHELEEALYDEDEARRAFNAFRAGDRSEWAVTGRRVAERRRKRARASKRSAAMGTRIPLNGAGSERFDTVESETKRGPESLPGDRPSDRLSFSLNERG